MSSVGKASSWDHHRVYGQRLMDDGMNSLCLMRYSFRETSVLVADGITIEEG